MAPGPLQMPHASSSPKHSSSVSQMPSLSESAGQSPPQTPSASSWLPLQSQSPAGMSVQPHSRMAPGPPHIPASIEVKTFGGRGVCVIASSDVGAVVEVVAQAIAVRINAIGNTNEADIIESKRPRRWRWCGSRFAIGPHWHRPSSLVRYRPFQSRFGWTPKPRFRHPGWLQIAQSPHFPIDLSLSG